MSIKLLDIILDRLYFSFLLMCTQYRQTNWGANKQVFISLFPTFFYTFFWLFVYATFFLFQKQQIYCVSSQQWFHMWSIMLRSKFLFCLDGMIIYVYSIVTAVFQRWLLKSEIRQIIKENSGLPFLIPSIANLTKPLLMP